MFNLMGLLSPLAALIYPGNPLYLMGSPHPLPMHATLVGEFIVRYQPTMFLRVHQLRLHGIRSRQCSMLRIRYCLKDIFSYRWCAERTFSVFPTQCQGTIIGSYCYQMLFTPIASFILIKCRLIFLYAHVRMYYTYKVCEDCFRELFLIYLTAIQSLYTFETLCA